MEDNLRVGQIYAGDGARVSPRASKEGALLSTDLGTRYGEAVSRDQVFTACTGITGIAPGTVLSTTPPLILYNPVGSNRNLEVIRSSCGYVSGTLGAGSLVYAGPSVAQPNAPTGGVALTAVCGRLGGADSASVAVVLQGATLNAVPRILRPAFMLGAALATTAAFPVDASDRVMGEYVVAPGNFICLAGIAAAGSLPLVLLGFGWREAPLA